MHPTIYPIDRGGWPGYSSFDLTGSFTIPLRRGQEGAVSSGSCPPQRSTRNPNHNEGSEFFLQVNRFLILQRQLFEPISYPQGPKIWKHQSDCVCGQKTDRDAEFTNLKIHTTSPQDPTRYPSKIYTMMLSSRWCRMK